MKRLMIATTLILAVGGSAYASLYSWNRTHRPPVSLEEALVIARGLLGDDAENRYCVSVTLYGNQEGDGREGAWNLLFAASDGSQTHVYVNMQGEGRTKPWNGPIIDGPAGNRRLGLEDLRTRLAALLENEPVEPVIEQRDNELLISYRTRRYTVHEQLDNGEYSENTIETTGPHRDGFWIRVQLVDQPDHRWYGWGDGLYWRWHRGTHHTTQRGKYLAVDFRYGEDTPHELSNAIISTFGERTDF